MTRFILLLALFITAPAFSQEINVMTFNIRYDNVNDGDDRWDERKTEVIELINRHAPQVIGLQEALLHQVEFVDSLLTDFAYIGVGRDDGKKAGEFTPIFYDSTKLELMDQGTFWLSTTPDSISIGWDAALPRISTYGILKEKESEKLIWVYNAHFDHIGEIARISSAATIVQHMSKNNISKSPVVLIGDLNATPDSRPIELLNNHFTDSMADSNQGTYWGFDPKETAKRRIDYIFVKDIEFTNAKIIKDLRNNERHISDHLPVMVTIQLDD